MFIRQKGSRDKETRPDNEVMAAPANPQTQEKTSPETMRQSSSQATSTVRTTAMIGVTVKVKGDVTSEENLVIEGQVDGTITLDNHELIVGQSGRLNADASAKIIKVDGEVNGDLVGKEKVVVSKTGNVRGNIMAPVVVLEEGAKFKGSIDMGAKASSGNDLPLTELVNAARSSRGDNAQKEPVPANLNHG